MGDYKGHMYLKEKILEFLVEKGYKKNEAVGHVKSMSDLVDLKVTFDGDSIICPVSQSRDNLVYLRPCGCVLSRKLIEKLVGISSLECPACSTPFEPVDMVIINATGKDIDLNKENYQHLQGKGLAHNKKSKKSKKRIHVDKTDPPNDKKRKL